MEWPPKGNVKMPLFKTFETRLKKSTQTYKVGFVLLTTGATRPIQARPQTAMDPTGYGCSPDHPLVWGRIEEDWAGAGDSHQDNLLSMFLAQLQCPQGARKRALNPKSPHSQLREASREHRRLFSTLSYFWNCPVLCFVLKQETTPVGDQSTQSIKDRQNLRPGINKLWHNSQIWLTVCFSK